VKAALAMALLAIAAAALPTSAQALAQSYHLNIPRQPLDAALKDLAQQTGLQIARFSDTVAGTDAVGPVRGDMSVAQALDSLLTASGLTYQMVNDHTVAVVPIGSDSNSRRDSGSSSTNHFGAYPTSSDERNGQTQTPDNNSSKSPLLAQTSPGETGGTSTQKAQDEVTRERSGQLEEVIVTAEKRRERLVDTPVSISVVSGEEIESRHLVNAEDYLRGMPGVNQTTDFLGQSIVIRGIETTPAGQNSLSGTTIATYFGEAQTTNSSGLAGSTAIDIKNVDISRVEVLRGPQGTAFGSSSLGGVVRTIPVAPRLNEVDGMVVAGYSRTEVEGGPNYTVQAVLNIPLVTDKIAVRAVAYRFDDSGYYRNIAGSDPATQAAAAAFGASAFAVDKDNIGATRAEGARVSALVQPSQDLTITFNYLTQNTELDGTPVADRPGYTQNFLQVAPSQEQRGETAGTADTHISLINAVLTQNLGWGSLLATYSETRSGTTRSESYSIFPGFYPSYPFGHSENGPHSEQNGEVRLTTQLQGAWNGLVGIFAENQDDDDFHEFLWYGTPETNFLNPGQLSIAHFTFHNNLRQTAAFGELSWKPFSKLTLTGGVRGYDYKRTTHARNEGALTPDGFQIVDREAHASGTTFKGNVSFKPVEDATLYATFAQGFRLGSPQQGVSPTVCDKNGDGIIDGSDVPVSATESTKSDTVDSYEAGGKVLIFDRRLQVDADYYLINWAGMPVYRFFQCGQNALLNAGKARSDGVEFQLSAFVTHSFRVDAGFSTIHARFLSDETLSLGAPPGTRLAGSPDLNANLGLEYALSVRDIPVTLRANAIYVGSFYGDPAQSPSTKAGDYTKVDLYARETFGKLDVDEFVYNVANADDYTFRFIYAGMGDFYGLRMRPRTFGFQLTYNF